MEIRISGIAAGPGVAIGPVYRWEARLAKVDNTPITADGIDSEKQRYRDAVLACAGQVHRLATAVGGEQGELLWAHLAILEDPFLEQQVFERIDALANAEHAVFLAGKAIETRFTTAEDELTRERAADVRDEVARLLEWLRGVPLRDDLPVTEPCIVLAQDLPPSFTAVMDRSRVLGFATELGGRTSHTAIMARTMDIPAVVGARGLVAAVPAGAMAVVDGEAGLVVLNPDEATLADALEKQRKLAGRRREMEALRALPAETLDGRRIKLLANIGFEQESAFALEKGAEGVGLLRTEYLYMQNRAFPAEDWQYATYSYVAKQMKGQPVVIRTLDIGGDKELPYYNFPKEANPMLGFRAIRFCLRNTDIFKTQIRAVLRASADGQVQMMLPMIASVEEFVQARALVEECMEELRTEGIPFDAQMPLGMMVETPAAVLLAAQLADHADFFSIGTNDLTQYVLAADRGNDNVQELFSGFHPAVVAAIWQVVQAAHHRGIPVSVCGEMAGDPSATALLLGLGVDELSMSPSSLPAVKQVIRGLRSEDAARLAQAARRAGTAAQVEKLLKGGGP